MTREEAIKNIKEHCYFANLLPQAKESLDMAISALSESKGEWIYDESIHNWQCSRCGQTPPQTGYVGTPYFMATHFKFCSHCGEDMRGSK